MVSLAVVAHVKLLVQSFFNITEKIAQALEKQRKC